MRVLVTGGSGFVGTNLISFYLAKGVEVLNIDIVPPRDETQRDSARQVDVMDIERLVKEFKDFKPDYVFHMAARTDLDENRRIDGYTVNFQGTTNVIRASEATSSVQRVVFASSMLVCKNGYKPQHATDYCPNTLYGHSKVLAEKAIHEAEEAPFSRVIVRPIALWGPWFGSPYREFFTLIGKGFYVHPGHANAHQSLGFVGNTVRQLDKLRKVPSRQIEGKVFYLADYPPTNIRVWAETIKRTMRARTIPSVPIGLLKLAAIMGDLGKRMGYKHPPLSTFRLNNMLTNCEYDIDPMISEEQRYSLEEGTQITVDWMRHKSK